MSGSRTRAGSLLPFPKFYISDHSSSPCRALSTVVRPDIIGQYFPRHPISDCSTSVNQEKIPHSDSLTKQQRCQLSTAKCDTSREKEGESYLGERIPSCLRNDWNLVDIPPRDITECRVDLGNWYFNLKSSNKPLRRNGNPFRPNRAQVKSDERLTVLYHKQTLLALTTVTLETPGLGLVSSKTRKNPSQL